jgi:hypothetical protein
MDEQLIALYHRHVATAFDRQLRLNDFLERHTDGQNWNYTISTATLEFGTQVQFEAHYLGSHAHPDNSWLWAWANPHLKLTAANRKLAKSVCALGSQTEVTAFSADRQFDLTPLFGDELSEHAAHIFGSVLGCELGYDAYYTIPFEHGRATALIRDDRLRLTEDFPINRILIVFPQVISALPVFDHKAALISYATAYRLTVTPVSDRLVITAAEGGELTATFDTQGRLADLKGFLGPTK